MDVLGIVTGPDVAPAAVLDPVLERLEDRGRVGIVRAGSHDADRTVYEVGDDGWSARGPGLGPEAALEELAADHDVGVIVGFPEAAVPQVAVGATDVSEPAVSAATPDELDLEAVEAALEAGEPVVTLDSLVAAVKASPKGDLAGAIATFTGRVRAKEGPEDDPTEALTFEKYDGVAAERMAEIAADLESWDGVHDVAMHHKVGRIERGEDIVFVVILAGHRSEAFEAVETGIDRLKEEVPIFKKETTVEEEFWRHERPP
jgi:molybdopterin synthase catalytic subunit